MKKNIVMSLVGTALVAAGMVVENKFGLVAKATGWVKNKLDKAKTEEELTVEEEQPAATTDEK